MTKNSQMLKNLAESAERMKQEKENLAKEIIQQKLQELNESLMNSFKQRLNIIESDITRTLYDSTSTLAIRTKTLIAVFLCGMLTMLILSGIVWYLWIKPYQVSPERTITTPQGQIYLIEPLENMREYKNNKRAILIH